MAWSTTATRISLPAADELPTAAGVLSVCAELPPVLADFEPLPDAAADVPVSPVPPHAVSDAPSAIQHTIANHLFFIIFFLHFYFPEPLSAPVNSFCQSL